MDKTNSLIKCTNHKKKKNRKSGAEGSKNEMKWKNSLKSIIHRVKKAEESVR